MRAPGLRLQRSFGGAEVQNLHATLGDGFVAKFNPTGSALIYSTYLGAEGDDCVTGIAVDGLGNAYMTGITSSKFLKTTTSALQPVYSGYSLLPQLINQLYGDAFVGKLDPTGSTLVYLTYLGGGANDGGMAIAVDSGYSRSSPATGGSIMGFTLATRF
jgi:hypothetical protein